MEKNQTFIGVAEGYTFHGEGVVKAGDIVFFVPGLIVSEEAELAVTAMKKNYGYARIIKILKPSKHRQIPHCDVYRLCGGCQLLHMDYEEQKTFKQDKVKGCFFQNAGMDIIPLPILYAKNQWAYRNKVQIPVQRNHGKVEMGFYQNHSNRIVEFNHCLVQTDISNDIVKKCKIWLDELRCANIFRHILIKHAHNSNQVMVCLIIKEYPFYQCQEFVNRIIKTFQNVVSVQCIVNKRSDNVILDGKDIQLYGKPYIEEILLGCIFRISARSFYQINPKATEILYSTALEYAQLSGSEIVIDLYCGTGTIGILASQKVKHVYGIEIVKDAIVDAKINAQINQRENIDFFVADAYEGANKLLKKNIQVDVVIVDPPRKGCSKDTLNAILKMLPQRIIYVSCDPATLARDCKYLDEKMYRIEKIQPVDMFPGTHHVECIALIQRVK